MTANSTTSPDARFRNMSLRMPRKAHDAIKALARNQSARASDLYMEIVQGFVSAELPGRRHFFAVENDAPAVTISVSPSFAALVRDTASSRKVSSNELIYTAVALRLERDGGAENIWGSESHRYGT